MSLKKIYDQAIEARNTTVTAADEARIATVRDAVRLIQSDNDFTARTEDCFADGFVVAVRPSLARADNHIFLSNAEIDGLSADAANPAQRVAEKLIEKLATKVAEARRAAALSNVLKA